MKNLNYENYEYEFETQDSWVPSYENYGDWDVDYEPYFEDSDTLSDEMSALIKKPLQYMLSISLILLMVYLAKSFSFFLLHNL